MIITPWKNWRKECWSTWLLGSWKITWRVQFFASLALLELVKQVWEDRWPRLWVGSSTGLHSAECVTSLIFEDTGRILLSVWSLTFLLIPLSIYACVYICTCEGTSKVHGNQNYKMFVFAQKALKSTHCFSLKLISLNSFWRLLTLWVILFE